MGLKNFKNTNHLGLSKLIKAHLKIKKTYQPMI